MHPVNIGQLPAFVAFPESTQCCSGHIVGRLLQRFVPQPDTFIVKLEFSCEYATHSLAVLVGLTRRLFSQYQIHSVGLIYQ